MKVFITAVIVAALAVGGFLVFHKSNKANSSNSTPAASSPVTTTPTQSSSTTSTPATSGKQQKEVLITYSDSGFSPSHLTVVSTTVVTIRNTSANDVQFQSNPHPLHTDDSDLNVGLIKAGQSSNFTATQKGTFGYHNHLDPSQGATITVE